MSLSVAASACPCTRKAKIVSDTFMEDLSGGLLIPTTVLAVDSVSPIAKASGKFRVVRLGKRRWVVYTPSGYKAYVCSSWELAWGAAYGRTYGRQMNVLYSKGKEVA